MDPRELVGVGGLVALVLLILLRIPVILAMIVVGIAGNFALSIVAPFLRFEPMLRQFKSLLWETVASYDLTVIPLFVLMGYAAAHAGLSRDLFGGVRVLVGRLRGGLAMSAIVGCAGFGPSAGPRWPQPRPWDRSLCPSLPAPATPPVSAPVCWLLAAPSAS